MEFQFYLSSIKSINIQNTDRRGTEFQFYLSSIKSRRRANG